MLVNYCHIQTCLFLQIAFESGFNSVPYFIKQFQSITEKTPGEYRELIGR